MINSQLLEYHVTTINGEAETEVIGFDRTDANVILIVGYTMTHFTSAEVLLLVTDTVTVASSIAESHEAQSV